MSDFQLESKSKVKEKQLAYLAEKAGLNLDSNAEEADIEEAVRELQRTEIGKPLFQKRKAYRHQLPFREDFQQNMEEVTADLNILSEEHQNASVFLKDMFNLVHSEKKRLTSRINGLNALSSDLLLITGKDNANTHYVKESFNRAEAMDNEFTIDSMSKASIHTGEGILTLARTRSENLSEEARISQVTGNGTEGTDHLVRKVYTTNRNGQEEERYRFVNEEEPDLHTQRENVLDKQPDTLFEYQRVNVPESFKKDRRYYDFEWTSSRKEEDNLRLKLVVELKGEEVVNWLTLHPYYANEADGKIIVRSIRTSLNGFDYEPLYVGSTDLNQTINATPQTYRLDEIFDGVNEPEASDYSGKGVWSFPHRKARFIEFVIDQPQSYPEVIGQAVYTLESEKMTLPVQIPEPEELKNQKPGEYIRRLDGERVVYKKEVQATTEGWRYAIGIRDINVMQYEYEPVSHFVSKRYVLPREAKRLMLYANEILPKNYLDILEKNNEWVQYEISFDDIDWHRMSPAHHEPLGPNFAPKILEINTKAIDLTEAFQVHKGFLEVEDPTHVRLRITLRRPEEEGFENTTPIVEEVALKVEMRESE